MKRSVLAVACIVGSLLVGNAQHAHAKQPRKLVKKAQQIKKPNL